MALIINYLTRGLQHLILTSVQQEEATHFALLIAVYCHFLCLNDVTMVPVELFLNSFGSLENGYTVKCVIHAIFIVFISFENASNFQSGNSPA